MKQAEAVELMARAVLRLREVDPRFCEIWELARVVDVELVFVRAEMGLERQWNHELWRRLRDSGDVKS